MANPEHLAILKQGVEEWNEWRKKNPEVLPDLGATDLHEANLRVANLYKADLVKTNLIAADLRGANLGGADLVKANLREADLTGAYLRRANLGGTILVRANLSGAYLVGSNLLGANLNGADLAGARAGQTSFGGVDLSAVRGLEGMEHAGPSTIGIDTIYKSKGNIPEVFLRGCGVPDDMIAYIRSIAGAVQFYSCFISYSTKDQEFADRLHADLQAKGVRCWFAPHDIRGGRKIHEQIDEAIRLHDKLLLILSEDSMASDWVQTEIAKARKREAQEKRQMLFPVALVPYDRPPGEAQERRSAETPGPVTIAEWECFDADRGKDSAREIREYFIPDFSNWKDHDSYQKAFQRLVSDLKAESRP